MAHNSTSVSKIFAERLSDLVAEAKESGIQIRELADKIGIGAGSLSQYQNDFTTASIEALYKIARYFNVSADYLLGLTHVRTDDKDIREVCDYTGLDEDVVKKLHDRQKIFYKGAMVLLNYLLKDETILNDLAEYYFEQFFEDENNRIQYIPLFQFQPTPPRGKGELFGNFLNDLPLDREEFHDAYKDNPKISELMGCSYARNELKKHVFDQMPNRLYKKYTKGIKMEEIDKTIFRFLSVLGDIEFLGNVVDLAELENRINSDLSEAEVGCPEDENDFDDSLPF